MSDTYKSCGFTWYFDPIRTTREDWWDEHLEYEELFLIKSLGKDEVEVYAYGEDETEMLALSLYCNAHHGSAFKYELMGEWNSNRIDMFSPGVTILEEITEMGCDIADYDPDAALYLIMSGELSIESYSADIEAARLAISQEHNAEPEAEEYHGYHIYTEPYYISCNDWRRAHPGYGCRYSTLEVDGDYIYKVYAYAAPGEDIHNLEEDTKDIYGIDFEQSC